MQNMISQRISIWLEQTVIKFAQAMARHTHKAQPRIVSAVQQGDPANSYTRLAARATIAVM